MTIPAAAADAEPEFASPTITASRRLVGANLFGVSPGAVIEVAVTDDNGARAVEQWPFMARDLAQALGWDTSQFQSRHGVRSASCYLSAPLDELMTATALAEQAWVLSEAYVAATKAPEAGPPATDVIVDMLRRGGARERAAMPRLRELAVAAREHGVAFTFDDEAATVGMGRGACAFALDRIAPSSEIDWSCVRDIPAVLVTGSNGKTTTTRLIAAMFRAAGYATGWNCSDGVRIESDRGSRELAAGDYTGPMGARLVIRDREVQAAVLETARGALLRRGLAITRATVAVITNISADHFGEYGVNSLSDLADAKAIVSHALQDTGLLVLNADDAELVALATRLPAPVQSRIVWFSTRADRPLVAESVRRIGYGAESVADVLQLCARGEWYEIGPLTGMPLTAAGAARHNVENVTAAALTACCAGVPMPAVQETLHRFGRDAHDNAGRLQWYRLADVTAVIDYAHNSEGMRALCATALSVPALRRLLVIGQAGNREDAQLRDLATSAWNAMPFDHVIVKDLPSLWRGRAAGEVPAIIAHALHDAGVPADRITQAPTEFDALRDALRWAKAGDMLVLPTHAERTRVTTYLAELQHAGWRAGEPLP